MEPWLADWHALRPAIDPLGIAVLGRLIRLGPAFEAARARRLAALGMTREVSDVCVSLLRVGPPHELNTGALAPQATLPIASSGAMTYRIDQAEKLGLVERKPDPNDRRGIIVALTPKGLETANRDVDVNVQFALELLEPFTLRERLALADLLRRLLAGVERAR